MVRVESRLPAEKGAHLLKDKLEEFDIVLGRDVIALTTDSARVMKKRGRIVGTLH
jgi:hypothetical protein